MDGDEITDEPLTEEELASSPLMEAGGGEVVVPTKGKLFAEDGSMKVAVIRPCISRGRAIGPRKLQPIYEATMLARSAAVFGDWPMYLDHLYEAAAVVEALRRMQRPITELGGRVLESWFDPEFVTKTDDEKGYRPGAVVGRVIPQPAVRAMLEADPGILQVSINAFPTGARPGAASWNSSLKGMLIEGISPTPRGSVDWVFRGGAGGHPIAEADLSLAVSVVESLYDPAHHEEHTVTDFAKMTLSELETELGEKNPELLRAIKERREAPKPSGGDAPTGITEEALNEALDRQKTTMLAEFDTKLSERDTSIEDEVATRLRERDELRELERFAHRLIESSTLPPSWKVDLKGGYTVLPSGPTQGLLVEATDDKTVQDLLKERIEEDVKHSQLRLREAQGGKPRVTGLGGGGSEDPPADEGEGGLEEALGDLDIPGFSKDKDGKFNTDGLLASLRG